MSAMYLRSADQFCDRSQPHSQAYKHTLCLRYAMILRTADQLCGAIEVIIPIKIWHTGNHETSISLYTTWTLQHFIVLTHHHRQFINSNFNPRIPTVHYQKSWQKYNSVTLALSTQFWRAIAPPPNHNKSERTGRKMGIMDWGESFIGKCKNNKSRGGRNFLPESLMRVETLVIAHRLARVLSMDCVVFKLLFFFVFSFVLK